MKQNSMKVLFFIRKSRLKKRRGSGILPLAPPFLGSSGASRKFSFLPPALPLSLFATF